MHHNICFSDNLQKVSIIEKGIQLVPCLQLILQPGKNTHQPVGETNSVLVNICLLLPGRNNISY